MRVVDENTHPSLRIRSASAIERLSGAIDGAAEGIRTPDPRITNAVLYRLSYRGMPTEWRFSNTRGLLKQGTPPTNCRRGYGAGVSLNRRDEGPRLPRIPMN
jgi:hypothetical protein